MKNIIEVPKLTSEVQTYERAVNVAIRQINMLTRQIVSQQEKIEAMKKDKEEFPRYKENWLRVRAVIASEIQTNLERIRKIREEMDSMSKIHFIKREKLEQEKLLCMGKIENAYDRLKSNEERYIKKARYIAGIDEDIKVEKIPNLQSHLGKLVTAVRNYRQIKDELMETYGIEIPEIRIESFTSKAEGAEFFSVNDEQDFFDIKFEQQWEDEEEESQIIED